MSLIDLPPADFNKLRLRTMQIEPSALLRLARIDAKTHCRFHTDARYRFDSPDGSFGVLYAAFDLKTAFCEAVLRDEPRNATAGEPVILDYSELHSRRVIAIKSGPAARSLRLIKLFDAGLAAARTDNRISSADEYSATRQWAKAFHDHPLDADGIVYMSRYLGSRESIVLFDRCTAAIRVGTVTPLLAHAQFPSIVEEFNLAIDPP